MTARREYYILYIPARGYVYNVYVIHVAVVQCGAMYEHDRFEKAMEEGYRIVFVLELGNLLRSEWKVEHELNQCLHLI